MMLREKEIEKMAEEIFQNCNCGLFFSEAEKIARFVIEEQGYRKQGEVVMEIFDDILKIKGLELHDWEAIFELKKKYTDGR